jgi:succinyl-CoA synthetase alpha subunit
VDTISRAGLPEIGVAHTISMDSEIQAIAFSSNGTKNADVFVVVNSSTGKGKPVVVNVKGTSSNKFGAYRTKTEDEKYKEIGVFDLMNGEIVYTVPPNTATTFFAD